MADQTGIDLVPYKQERHIQNRQKVKLYYVNPEYDRAHKGRPPQQTVKNMAYEMPALGEYMIIDEVFADDVLSKTGFKGKPIFMLESEGGAEVAAMIKEAIAEGGDFSSLDVEKVALKRKLAKLSDEEVALLLEQRGLSVQKSSVPKADPKKDDKKPPPKSSKDDKEEEKEGDK